MIHASNRRLTGRGGRYITRPRNDSRGYRLAIASARAAPAARRRAGEIFTNTFLNELRGGFNVDEANRRGNFDAGQLADEWGLEIPAEGRDRLGHAAFVCQGPNSPTLLRDLRQNVLRDTETTSFSLSDNVTWITGRHSLRVGGAWSRNHILDGFSAGANEGSGQFLFNGAASGNSFSDFLLGVPFRSSAQIISSTGCSPTARRRLDLCRCPQPCRPSLECLASASCSSPCGAWR
ncbi:MAG: hypothetical protein H0V80_17100 [Acidobacteria bacterium]|nr:hypothetical protein [Acidobacteriota bacterium]